METPSISQIKILLSRGGVISLRLIWCITKTNKCLAKVKCMYNKFRVIVCVYESVKTNFQNVSLVYRFFIIHTVVFSASSTTLCITTLENVMDDAMNCVCSSISNIIERTFTSILICVTVVNMVCLVWHYTILGVSEKFVYKFKKLMILQMLFTTKLMSHLTIREFEWLSDLTSHCQWQCR